MLITIGRHNPGSIHNAVKHLLGWAISRKQDIHSSFKNCYQYDRFQRFNRNRRRRDMTDDLLSRKREFLKENLTEFNKSFYSPHPDVSNRSQEEIENFLRENEISYFGKGSQKRPSPILSFDELDLPSEAMNLVRELGYTKPTPIQSVTWPIALSGHNMVGVARTGSGKTLGFVLPGLTHAKYQPEKYNEGPIAVVISPTRELAQQIEAVLRPFSRCFNIYTACVFGGTSKLNQERFLRRADFCVATPGRLLDFLRDDVINLSRCTYFVLDEADRLLDMGFEPQIRSILNQMRSDSQILMWSATWPKNVQSLAQDFLKDYIGVRFGSSELTVNPNITQHIHVCEQMDKKLILFQLWDEIQKEPDHKTLIFCKTKKSVDYLSDVFRRKGIRATSLHGDISQPKRDLALQAFRSGNSQILVGTCVVGRGIDITDIKYVINYDFPFCIEDYIHIIGRTGRVENKGIAHTLFTPEDANLANDLINVLRRSNQEVNPELLEMDRSRDNSRRHSDRYSYRPSPQRRRHNW